MVVLTLSPYRGNHARFFPHAGYLGLTPVVIQGQVRTVLEEDRKPLRAASVCVRVRCYEADVTNARTKGKGMNVLFDSVQEVWSKGRGGDWEDLGEMSAGFRIVVPVDAVGVTTTTFKNYKTWWQVEAVIFHKPSSLLGSRLIVSHQIPLTRYTSPRLIPSSPPSWTSSPTTRYLAYAAATSSASYGPNEPISLDLSFTKSDPTLQIKRIQVSLDRHMTIDTSSTSPVASDIEDISLPDDDQALYSPSLPDPTAIDSSPDRSRSTTKGLSSVFRRSSSLTTAPPPFALGKTPSPEGPSYFAPRPTPPTTSGGSKASTTASVLVLETEDIVWAGESSEVRLEGVVPKNKSIYRYSIGETIKTKFASIHFTVSVKFFIKTRSGGNEIIDLDPRPILIAGASQEDRAHALAQAGRLLAVADAELRLFGSTPLDSSPSPPPRIVLSKSAALGARRASNFASSGSGESRRGLSPSPASEPEFGRTKEGEMAGSRLAGRRRSDQSESGEAPLKAKVRITQAPSSFAGHPPLHNYVSSTLSQPPLQNSPSLPPAPHFDPSAPPPQHFPLTLPSRDHLPRTLASPRGHFPLAHPPPSPDSSRPAHPRRSNRSTAPYSAASRPRSAGGLSQRSWKDDESDSSITPSVKSSNSGKHYTRERSAPLPSMWSPTLLSSDPLSFPLSLYPLHPSPPLSTALPNSFPSTPPLPSSPANSFQSFSLSHRISVPPTGPASNVEAPWTDISPLERNHISPLERNHISPLERNPRRPATAPAHVPPRSVSPHSYLPLSPPSSGKGFAGKEEGKEGRRWAFLRRGMGKT